MPALAKPYTPQKLTPSERMFSGDVTHLMPRYDDARKDPLADPRGDWYRFIRTWTYDGLIPGTTFLPKEGVDAQGAYNHLEAVMRSYKHEHEHKMAAAAVLAGTWFHAVLGPDKTALFGTIPEEMVEKEPTDG